MVQFVQQRLKPEYFIGQRVLINTDKYDCQVKENKYNLY